MKLWQTIRRLWLRRFPHYRVLETRFVSYTEANRLISESRDKPEAEQWSICGPLEDYNTIIGRVYLCRRERVRE